MTDKNKTNPAQNMALPEIKEKPKQTLNGKLLSKYTPVFIIQAVYCQNCQAIAMPSGISYVDNLTALEQMAEQMHKQVVVVKRILCTTPKLIFSYSNGFVDV